MKFLFDFIPLILFFAAFKLGGYYPAETHALVEQYLSGVISGGVITQEQAPMILATAICILATVLQIAYLLVRRQKVHGMLWLTLAVVGIFGGLTIYLHDNKFIQWKPTLIYWLTALGLLGGQVIFKRNLIRQGMESQFKLPDDVWQKLLFAWIAFFAAMGALNLYVAFVFYKDNLDAWVSFKAFGATGLFFVFSIGQAFVLAKHLQEEQA